MINKELLYKYISQQTKNKERMDLFSELQNENKRMTELINELYKEKIGLEKKVNLLEKLFLHNAHYYKIQISFTNSNKTSRTKFYLIKIMLRDLKN